MMTLSHPPRRMRLAALACALTCALPCTAQQLARQWPGDVVVTLPGSVHQQQKQQRQSSSQDAPRETISFVRPKVKEAYRPAQAGAAASPGTTIDAAAPSLASSIGAANLPPGIDEAAIKRAIRETLDEALILEQLRLHSLDTVRANRYESFAAQMHEARVPDCLHEDGLKRAPPVIGPIAFGGVLGLPFIAIAKLRGKCN